MIFANMLSITSRPFLAVLIWVVLLLAALYFARRPFHRVVMSLSRIVSNAMRLASASVLLAEKRLVRRNREVLMAAGRQKAERIVEREFGRISAAVTRDLEGYPHLHRQLSNLINKLDESYHKGAEVPPSLPSWLPIIEAIAQIKHSGDSMVANMLAEINRTLTEQHQSALESYRRTSTTRHNILNKMLPLWRKIQNRLDAIGKSIKNLNNRATSIDRYMDEYEQIRQQTDQAARTMCSSSLTQFFISGLLLVVALGGALINFNLIARPLSAMFGDAGHIGLYQTAYVASLVIILIEFALGFFLMESLRVTRLFPTIGSMDDKMRLQMVWLALAFLTILACLETVLTLTQGQIALSLESSRSALIETEPPLQAPRMILGFVLPFFLASAAIPAEFFISSSRTALGILGAVLLRLLAFFLRLIGNVGYYTGRFIVNVYDLAIFPTIWLEEALSTGTSPKNNRGQSETKGNETPTLETMKAFDRSIELTKQQE
ncbi:MAG: hypothetical protein JSW39_16450 [Desulfobacterales bacterium]|nr:MAG: hypothetical protein JSW39_16450 [Desulfobacterales bacterium]